jgi:hypothetical protein
MRVWKGTVAELWYVLCAPVPHHAVNETLNQAVSGTRPPKFMWWVRLQQWCQLSLPCLSVTTIINKDYQLRSVKVTLHSYHHSHFFFFNRRYNPWWVLACFMISFHNLLSLHFSLQFLTFIFFRSSSTWSIQLSLGFPTGLDEPGSHSVNYFTVLTGSILITCVAHRNLCDFMNLTIFSSPLPHSFKVTKWDPHPDSDNIWDTVCPIRVVSLVGTTLG